MHFTYTACCCVCCNSVTNLNAEHKTTTSCTEANVFLKTRCKNLLFTWLNELSVTFTWLTELSVTGCTSSPFHHFRPPLLSPRLRHKFSKLKWFSIKKRSKSESTFLSNAPSVSTQHCCLKDSHASPVCPAGKRNMYMKSMERRWNDTNRVQQKLVHEQYGASVEWH